MRKRTVNRKWTYLPNASTLGYGDWKARPGDYVTVRLALEGGGYIRETGRVIGQIESCDSDGKDCRGHIVVAMFYTDLTGAHETWIDPADVLTCMRPGRVNLFLRAMAKSNVPEMERALNDNDHFIGVDSKTGRLWVQNRGEN